MIWKVGGRYEIHGEEEEFVNQLNVYIGQL